MHVELGTYDLFVLVLVCLGYLLNRYHNHANIPRSLHDEGPWSPFDGEHMKVKVEEKAEEQKPSSASSFTESDLDLASPAETPDSSQAYPVSPAEDPSVVSVSTSPSSSRSASPVVAIPVSVSGSESSLEDEVVPYNLFTSRILTNDLLYDLMLFPADPCTLIRLSHTCRAAHSAVHSHIARTFNINTHLSRYFPDPLAFRSLQAATGTLVSGSNALQFLTRTLYPEADLDLYCFYDARAEVGFWLMDQGYRFTPNSRQDPSFRIAINQAREPGTDAAANPYSRMKAVSAVYTFIKRVDNPEGPSTRLKVQIIVAYENPMEAIFHFHSTAVLNVISYSHAYALYPRATFHDRVTLSLLPLAMLDDSVEAKYAARGWRFIHTVPSPLPDLRIADRHTGRSVMMYTRYGECYQCEHCMQRRAIETSIARGFPTGSRWIGDKHSWVVPLDLAGVELPTQLAINVDAPPLPRDPSFVTSWEMVDRKPRHGAVGKKITAKVVTADGFWYAYVINDEKLKAAMAMIQELYVHIPGVISEDQYCDGEFIKYCETMLESHKLWDRWYPKSYGRMNPILASHPAFA